MGWYYGFKLHLLCNERGELLNFALTKANVDDRNPEVFNNLTKDLFGKLYADKGYISQSLFASLFDRGVHIVTGIRTNMKNRLMDVYYLLHNTSQFIFTHLSYFCFHQLMGFVIEHQSGETLCLLLLHNAL